MSHFTSLEAQFMFLRARAPGTAPMAFSAVGLTAKVKKEMDVGEEAERAVTAPSPNCSGGYNPIVYSLGTRDQRQNNYLQRHFPNQPTAQGAAQSQHIFLNEATSRGVGRATHDFLSLYGGTPSHFVQPIPMTRGASSSLATQDLLQPLERGNSPKYQESEVLLLDKPTKEETLSQHGGSIAAPVVGDRLLPIFVSSQMNASMEIPQMQLLRLAGPEGNAQGIWCNPQMSLSASHEEHLLVESMRSSDATVEQEHIENRKCWSNPRNNYALSDLLYVPKGSSNHGPLDGSYQPVPVLRRHWQKGSHPFVEVIKRPFKVPSEDDEEDEVEGLDHTIDQSKESHFVKGEHASRDGKNIEARATTPRSKHSATEQRRRSKINDRFQTLRNLVPHSDQKRDKASFLLEVIEYVQVLQEKVLKYEGVEQGRHQEGLNNVVWESCKKSVAPEAFSRDATTMDNAVFLKNITSTGLAVDVKPISETHDFIRPKLIIFSPSASENGTPPCVRQQSASYINGRSAVISNGIDSSPENQNCKSVIPKPCSSLLSGHHDLRATVPTPRSVPDSQMISCLPKRCGATCNMDELAHLTEESMSAANLTEQSQTQWDAKYPVQLGVEPQGGWSAQFMEPMPAPEKSVTPVNSIQGPSGGTIASNQMHNTYHVNGVVATNKEEIRTYASKDTPATHIRDDSFAVTGGIISVSSLYSQELLETLTRALQSSGLDLSRANISVQIDLGKRGEASTAFSSDKHTIGPIPESSSQSQKSKDHARTAGMRSESDVPWKKPKLQHV